MSLKYEDLTEDEQGPFLICCLLSIAFWVPATLAVFFGLAALFDLSLKQILLITPLWILAGGYIGTARGEKWGFECAAKDRCKVTPPSE